eukprot:gene70-439_t
MKWTVFAAFLAQEVSAACSDACKNFVLTCAEGCQDCPSCIAGTHDATYQQRVDAYDLQDSVCTAALEEKKVYCGPEIEGVSGCDIGEKLLGSMGADTDTIRNFLTDLFDDNLDGQKAIEYGRELVLAQWVWLLPFVLFILFLVIIIFTIPLACCCFKNICMKCRCAACCFKKCCFNTEDPNMYPKWNCCKKVGMLGTMALMTGVGITVASWANLTYNPQMTDGIEEVLCEGSPLMNVVQFGSGGEAKEAAPVGVAEFIGIEPALAAFDGLVAQLEPTGDLRTGIQDILDSNTDLQTKADDTGAAITTLSGYATDNAGVTNGIESLVINNFPTNDVADVNDKLQNGVANALLEINAQLDDWFTGSDIDDLRNTLQEAKQPMVDMADQVSEAGSMFADKGKDFLDKFKDYAWYAITAVGATFGVFTLLAFLASFAKVFIFKFDKNSFRDDEGGCFKGKRRYPAFGGLCVVACFFAMIGLLVGGVILLITIPVSESCVFVQDLLASETPGVSFYEELPRLVPGQYPTPDDNFKMVMDLAVSCIAENPADEVRGDLLGAVKVEFDINAAMADVTQKIKDMEQEQASIASSQDYVDLMANVNNYGPLWTWTTDKATALADGNAFATANPTFAAQIAASPTDLSNNAFLTSFLRQAGDLTSTEATISVTDPDSGDSSDFYPIIALTNQIKASFPNFCWGVTGAASDQILGAPGGCTTVAAMDKTASLDAAVIFWFGTELVTAFEATGYSNIWGRGEKSKTFQALRRASGSRRKGAQKIIDGRLEQRMAKCIIKICMGNAGDFAEERRVTPHINSECKGTPVAAWEMQACLAGISTDLDTAVNALDAAAGTMQTTMISSIEELIETIIVEPTKFLLENLNCQWMGQHIRATIDDVCDTISPSFRGLALAWSVLGCMGCLTCTLMFFIWHHLKSKWFWEHSHSEKNADYE